MSDFGGIFEALAADETDIRLASRKALNLAESRVSGRLGTFLAASHTPEEFDARLSYVEDEFKGLIATACEETGHGKPETIEASLKAHYRLASVRTAADEATKLIVANIISGDVVWKEPKGYVKEALTRQHYNLIADAIKSAPIENHSEVANHFADHLQGTNERFDRDRFVNAATPSESDSQSGGGQSESKTADASSGKEGSFPCQSCGTTVKTFQGQGNGECPNCGAEHLTNGQRASKDYNPSDQDDDSDKEVPCPECGGDGKTNGDKKCPRCKGHGRVQDWGPSTLDALESSAHEQIVSGDKKWIQKAVKKPGELHKDLGFPEGEKIPEEKLEEAEHSDDPKVKERAQFAENVKGLGKKKADGESEEERLDKESPPRDPQEACPGCGKIAHFGQPIKHAPDCPDVQRESSIHVADNGEGNTGLDGPEPKMDKRLWTPKNLKKLEVPSERHPNREKDPIEPIKAVNDDPLTEIGEKTTESQDLPEAGINLDDSGFAGNNQDMAPGTKTWTGTDGLADPVTNKAFAKVDDVNRNPVRDLLLSESGFVAPSVIDRLGS